MTQPTIHWLGAGLSSAPGIVALAKGEHPLVLWNRTPEKARAIVSTANTVEVRALDLQALAQALNAGDVLVSMLPADWHVKLANLAMDAGAHFVSSSYIAPEMAALDARAQELGLCLVNEVGLDPGIDHLMAHDLIQQYRDSAPAPERDELYFRSYCGGFPAQPNDFRYKFSWSPLGVLRALRSPARCLEAGEEKNIQRPWHGISEYQAQLGSNAESFEAYPNRDSLPFIQQYGLAPEWPLQQFVRGTLRLAGWSLAWQSLFDEIEGLSGDSGEARLQALSDQLWRDYQYDPGEADRVVLCVELEARHNGGTSWHRSYSVDARGNDKGSAMARLVSLTVAIAVDSVLAGRIAPGVSAAPHEASEARHWLDQLRARGEVILTQDRLT